MALPGPVWKPLAFQATALPTMACPVQGLGRRPQLCAHDTAVKTMCWGKCGPWGWKVLGDMPTSDLLAEVLGKLLNSVLQCLLYTKEQHLLLAIVKIM